MKREHASFADFLDFAADETKPRFAHAARETGARREKLSGSGSFDSALKLAREGWADGRAEIEKWRAQFSALIGSKMRRRVLANDVCGFAPDVGAFLNGEPENMFARAEVETAGPGKILRIAANGSCSWDVSRDSIMRRGAAIVALIDALESAGYSCEVILGFSAWDSFRNPGECSFDSMPLKSAGEPLDIDRAAFALAHPSMLRRLVFSCKETDGPFMRVAASHYGYSKTHDNRKSGLEDGADIYIGSMFTGDRPDSEMLAWFRAQLARAGITFED